MELHGLGSSIFSTSGTDVAFGNGLWVATGSGGNSIATSTNGTTWTGRGTSIFSGSGFSLSFKSV